MSANHNFGHRIAGQVSAVMHPLVHKAGKPGIEASAGALLPDDLPTGPFSRMLRHLGFRHILGGQQTTPSETP